MREKENGKKNGSEMDGDGGTKVMWWCDGGFVWWVLVT
jgi:hypothetical protein